jgi:hypothetical protein
MHSPAPIHYSNALSYANALSCANTLSCSDTLLQCTPAPCLAYPQVFAHFTSGYWLGCPRCKHNPFLARLHELARP